MDFAAPSAEPALAAYIACPVSCIGSHISCIGHPVSGKITGFSCLIPANLVVAGQKHGLGRVSSG